MVSYRPTVCKYFTKLEWYLVPGRRLLLDPRTVPDAANELIHSGRRRSKGSFKAVGFFILVSDDKIYVAKNLENLHLEAAQSNSYRASATGSEVVFQLSDFPSGCHGYCANLNSFATEY